MTCISANRHLLIALLRTDFRIPFCLHRSSWLRAICLSFVFLVIAFPMTAQEPTTDSLSVRSTIDMRVGNPRSTGRSSGVIATVSVENNGSKPISLKAQFFFVPPSKSGSGYVGRIPRGLHVESDSTVSVEVYGYRINASRPPVGDGEAMQPASRWIVFTEMDSSISQSTSHTTLAIISGPEQRPFRPTDIPNILASTGFTSDTVLRTMAAMFPSTSRPIQGFIDPMAAPTDFAGLLTAIVLRVERAAAEMMKRGEIHTPFSDDYNREFETLVLHAVWLTTSVLTGSEYSRKDFSKEMHRQLSPPNHKLTAAEKEEFNKGINELWDAVTEVAHRAGVVAGIDADAGQ